MRLTVRPIGPSFCPDLTYRLRWFRFNFEAWMMDPAFWGAIHRREVGFTAIDRMRVSLGYSLHIGLFIRKVIWHTGPVSSYRA